jgi:manganese/iron transport system permease protein
MMPLALVTTISAMMFGIYLSFWIDSAPAPTVIMVLTSIFIYALVQKNILIKG